MDVQIGDGKLFTLQFADDQIISAENKDDICYTVRKLNDAYNDWRLAMNIEKTEYLVNF